ncbi:MAG: 2-amino-4-hydroxy-6-hydroxymethyldihydropteridine diphosphokinase, partial [Anaerolineales bacterium]|nr:2-amino-4-hydroxy-6-hydroxymethyldihydropteridine diphosphokinase [Anaerolineales bacterium]
MFSAPKFGSRNRVHCDSRNQSVWRSSGARATLTELAFIALGSNIDPETNLPLAAARLSELGKPIAVSTVYQNPAIADEPQPDYLNVAVLIETALEPLKIRDKLRKIEADLGRIRTNDKDAPRTIDLDLCMLGDRVLDHELLTLPDPDLLKRAHLAVTTAELRPDFPHPLTGETLEEIANKLR